MVTAWPYSILWYIFYIRIRLYKQFKKYSLINFDEDEDGEDMKIRLYPSLQFGWDIPQFQTVAREYLKLDGEDEDEAGGFEEESQQVDWDDYEEDET